MALTDTERTRLRGQWRQLVDVACGHDPEALKVASRTAHDLRSPADDEGDAFLLFAFARLARAVARTRPVIERGVRWHVLRQMAVLVVKLLGDPEPAPAPAPPALPFRADLDG